MRRVLGILSLIVGAFALLIGILAKPVIYEAVSKVELDQNSVSVSRGENMSALQVSGEGINKLEGVTLISTRTVAGIPGLAEGNNAFWQTAVESAVEDGPLLTYSDEGVSFDRTTALATNCCGDYIAVGDAAAPDDDATREAIQHDGLFFKFPFDTQQEDYPYWDGALGHAVTAEFSGEESVEGVTTYKFVMELGPEEVSENTGLPGELFGTDQPVDAGRIYQNTRTLWVEPNSGVIIRGLEEQNVHFAPRDSSLPTVPITVGTIGYTDETIKANADEYGSKGALLGFINGPLTWVGILVGLALIALGAFLALGGNRNRQEGGVAYGDDDPTGYTEGGFDEPGHEPSGHGEPVHAEAGHDAAGYEDDDYSDTEQITRRLRHE